MTDQPIFEAEYVEQRSRATTFFRYFLVIPHLIVLSLWGFAAFFAVIAAWFAIVLTGRYPEGLYNFVAGLLRYSTAATAYYLLLTDQYPPFSGDTDAYPAHLRTPPPKAEYDRLKTLFRIILAIPPAIIAYAMSIVASLAAFVAWFVIVITGKQPKGLQDATVLGVSYQQRANAYMLLLTEDWPSFNDPQAALAGA
ncbi:MAG: hypothetical protein JWQ18_699, partial [Conexibacter sp.]|nr:hypothetical protein [Conexibacter sp.]